MALGKRRQELQKSEELAIYTVPPSAALLHHVLEDGSPNKVYLFSVMAAEEAPEGFLRQLSGLCKYALVHRDGRASLMELAAASSQREITVLHGLEWLRAAGHIAFEGEDELTLLPGSGSPNPILQAEFSSTLSDLLSETPCLSEVLPGRGRPRKPLGTLNLRDRPFWFYITIRS